MTTTAYMGLSLDGFIARPDGGLDWLQSVEGPGEDYGYAEFMARVDAIVMGRATYDKVLTFGAWPYKKPVFVLTHRPLQDPNVEALSGTPRDVVRELAKRGHGRLYVDGGKTVQEFLAAGALDEIVTSRLPVLIGQGIPLFGPLPHDVQLEHQGTQAFASGLVQSRYTVRTHSR